ncbi:MAG: type I DNA topoisomerase, partial [Christiangramia sp.]|nr:type I DNA topoisomerase [Christiangramia sp.]
HEITKAAISAAIENPRGIDYDLVDAQQARRVLDRIVGYELSPVLWRKVKGGLSAGRVQSVSVRLIVEREREIKEFKAVASYRIDAEFKTENGQTFRAKLSKPFSSKEEALKFLQKNVDAIFKVSDLEKKPGKKSPAAPFTTSTLQQEASRKLGFSVNRTMANAQRLYESGLITYMRTDSVNLSNEARHAAEDEIIKSFGSQYSKPRNYKGKSKGAQEAHEAIRPTDFTRSSVNSDRDQSRLYELIWKRAIASQMAEAQLERTNVKINTASHNETFTANGEVIKFDGFLIVYLESTDDEDVEQEGMLPALKVNETLIDNYITATERYTRPPYRYTEASLVKKLEELGIGRPSTYAPTISTIQNRNYVEKGSVEGTKRKYTQLALKKGEITDKQLSEKVGSDKGKLIPTDIGMIVTDFLVNHFESILDYNFTAKVEADFDDIAEGKVDWSKMMKDFYKTFHPQVEHVHDNAERESGERILGIDPKTGRQVSVKLGRFGPMVQIGTADEEDKPLFASLTPDQQLNSITFEEAMDLFHLPKTLGDYQGETIEVNSGRFGPYVKFGKKFVSLPKGVDPMSIELDDAIILIKEKEKADAPIYTYKDFPVTKGKGRFGPFIKWNNMFINVGRKYDWDNLSHSDIVELIEDKLQKEKDKIVHNWEEEGIRVEKARWGRHHIIKGKTKIELAKTVDVSKFTLDDAKDLIEKKAPKKKATKRKTASKKS